MIDNRKVTEALERLKRRDRDLGEELDRKLSQPLPEVALILEGPGDQGPPITLETIVLRTGRPVLAILADEARLEFEDVESEVWKDRLERARLTLKPRIQAVGRIELSGDPFREWAGTGWLVHGDVVATNRHVAELFARNSSAGFVFKTGLGGDPIGVSIDFLEEFDNPADRTFQLSKVLHIEPEGGPDLAFLQVKPNGAGLSKPIPLSEGSARADQQVVVIGYPARDSRIPEQDLMERIFGNVYNKKRLAPGQITEDPASFLLHDCSTLGGNSGSVVLDLTTGEALGIHFAGRFLDNNFAVPAPRIKEKLQSVLQGGARPPVVEQTKGGGPGEPVLQSTPGTRRLSCTIPIHLTIEVGDVVSGSIQGAGGGPGLQPPRKTVSTGTTGPVPGSEPDEFGDDDEFETEATPEEYLDREGYRVGFLGHGVEVPMPQVILQPERVLAFDFAGNAEETELRYQHFSVVMNRDRRLCFFSAVNINGNLSKKKKRTGWRLDPRIPVNLQIKAECYGNFPKFSRGHMTRREDPVWGTHAAAGVGNSDSMHVTNAVPQMQPFNGGIWLGLEDYALDHAREDDMKICVLTGPVFRPGDPIRFGVRIPIVFWKVIAFIHDETGKLSATGYSISQADFITTEAPDGSGPVQEFVFGQHETFQRSLRWIEDQTGLSFGSLTGHDLFAEVEEAAPIPLQDFHQIRLA